MDAIPPLMAVRIGEHQRVLIAGCGGGFDLLGGLPLFWALRQAGYDVHLASLSGASLVGTDAPEPIPGLCWAISDTTRGVAYLPEQLVASFLASRGVHQPVYAFPMVGVRGLTSAFRSLAAMLQFDVVITVDRGADSLLRGDEFSLGTPSEEMATLTAWSCVEGVTALHCCVGFGIDAYHGVSHVQVLRAIAALTGTGNFLGAATLVEASGGFQFYRDAVRHANARIGDKPSIVHNAVVAAVEGRFGRDFDIAGGRASEVWISPLLAFVWAFDLRAVADRMLFREPLLSTETFADVVQVITAGRAQIRPRPAESMPI